MRERIGVDGGGAARCAVCGSSLDYCWIVVFDDGSIDRRCATHLDEKFDNRSN